MKYINLLKKGGLIDRQADDRPTYRYIDKSLYQDQSASIPGEGQMYDYLDIMQW